MKITIEVDKLPDNFTGIVEYVNDGVKYWYKNGLWHREDGPAVEYADGSKWWFRNGKYHREDGPACESFNGTKSWFKNGLRHREDGPAVEYPDGTKFWYLNGKRYSEQDYKKEIEKHKNSCNGKVVEIDGKKYKLTEIG